MQQQEGVTRQGAQSDAKRVRRSPVQRELHRTLISDRLLEGRSERTIASELGLSQSTIHRDIEALKQEWLERRLRNRDELLADELRFIGFIQREAISEWRRSKSQPVTKRSSKSRGFAPKPTKAGEKVTPTADLLLIEQQVKSEERLGDPRYLESLAWCSSERSRLLGLHAPAKVAQTTPEGDAAYVDARDLLLGVIERQCRNANSSLPVSAGQGAPAALSLPATTAAEVGVIEAVQTEDGSFDATGATGEIVPDVPVSFRLR
jgi:DNA-binding transcriptional MocR family regulator